MEKRVGSLGTGERRSQLVQGVELLLERGRRHPDCTHARKERRQSGGSGRYRHCSRFMGCTTERSRWESHRRGISLSPGERLKLQAIQLGQPRVKAEGQQREGGGSAKHGGSHGGGGA